MSQVLGQFEDWTWVVPSEQFDDYREAGAAKIAAVPSRQVTHQRQFCIDEGKGHQEAVVMVDDDLQKIVRLNMTHRETQSVSVDEAADIIYRAMLELNTHLGGVGPTNNAYFVKKEIQPKLFIRSGLIVVRPTEIEYDHRLKVKEDYDFTCQHLERDGSVTRYDALLATFQQRTNGGGCQDYRDEPTEKAAVDWLCEKWPNAIKPHATRANEVSLRWR